MNRPLPDLDDEEFAPFWVGTRRGALLVHQCSTCGTHRWPPRPLCSQCHGLEFDWVEVEPLGSLHTWTVVVHQTVPTITPPYVVGLIELDDPAGIRFLGYVLGCDPKELHVGLAMKARFEAVTDEVTLVNWEPAPAAP